MSSASGSSQWTLVFTAQRARDLMTPSPVSVRGNATIAEAIRVMTDRAVSAVPVINDAGRPVGVLSRTDILVHSRESPPAPAGAATASPARVSDVMTPAIFTVPPEMLAPEVVGYMVQVKVNQLFVVDADNSIIGVISALDVLSHAQI